MPWLFSIGEYNVYVRNESRAKHRLKHCSVSEGKHSKRGRSAETVLSLPGLRPIAGPALPSKIMKAIEARVDEIAEAYDRQNPQTNSRTSKKRNE
jgi:hypothetical protein